MAAKQAPKHVRLCIAKANQTRACDFINYRASGESAQCILFVGFGAENLLVVSIVGRSVCCVIVFDVVAFAVDLVTWVSKCRRGIVNA